MSPSALADVMMDGDYWHGRSQATGALAEAMKDPVAKSMLLAIGAEYELLAQRMDEWTRQRSSIEQHSARLRPGCARPHCSAPSSAHAQFEI
jgi:hypothetical protein